MHVQTTRVFKIWSACRSRSCLLKIQVDGISAVPGDIYIYIYIYKPLPLYAPGLHAIWVWFALCACAKPLAKILATPLDAYEFHTTGNRRMDSQLLPVPYIAHALCSVLTHLSGIF